MFSVHHLPKQCQVQSTTFDKIELCRVELYQAELSPVVTYYDVKKKEHNLTSPSVNEEKRGKRDNMLLFLGCHCSQLCANTGRIFTAARGNLTVRQGLTET